MVKRAKKKGAEPGSPPPLRTKHIRTDSIDIASQIVRGDVIQASSLPLRHFKLVGLAGHGKTQLLLSELQYMKALEIEPERVALCLIDCDTQGQDWQIHDKKLVPPDYAKCIFRYTAHNYAGCMAALQFFQDNVIAQLKADFPDDNGFSRYVGVEDEAKFWAYCRNFYAGLSRGEGIDTELDLILKARRIQAKTGKFAPTYSEGRREAFGSINGLLIQFMTELKLGASELGYNAFSTSKMSHKTLDYGKPTEREVVRIEGRPDITNGYFDFVFRVQKFVEEGWDKKKKERTANVTYAIIVDENGKARGGRSFTIRNKGAQYLWEYVTSLERELDGEEKG